MTVTFPKFLSSDEELNITYNYRCELYGRHVKETPAGYVITEFLPDVPWAGIYNTISCAASHHFRDGRWMHNPAVLDEYAGFWCTEGNPRLYSFPIADSILALAKVTGDYTTADVLYPKLAEIQHAWDDHKTDSGMYRQLCDRDGMEFSISGDGIRPTINSYMYADKAALSVLAGRAGDSTAAQMYREDAETLRGQINDLLWNDRIGMYGVISDDGEVQNVREQIGYIPWIYGIPASGRDDCFRNLLDTSCFLAPHGLRTADASHPDYMKPFNHSCLWNGPVWPYSTSIALTGLAKAIAAGESGKVSADDYVRLLGRYARSHVLKLEDGSTVPWIDENMNPFNGDWIARTILKKQGDRIPDRGKDYNHSTFCNLVIEGLLGIKSVDGKVTVNPRVFDKWNYLDKKWLIGKYICLELSLILYFFRTN